jgi:hypothetical protein
MSGVVRLQLFVLWTSAILLLGSAALSAESVTIVNRTGTDIELIQVVPEGSGNWGDDLIPNRVVNDGESTVLDLAGSPPFSMRLLDTAGVVYVLYDVVPGRTGKISVGPEHRAELTRLAGSRRLINIANRTGNTITSLRISAVDDGIWGKDLLSGRFIRNGETMDIVLETVPGILDFDIRFTLSTGTREVPYEKPSVILTDGASLVLSIRQDS